VSQLDLQLTTAATSRWRGLPGDGAGVFACGDMRRGQSLVVWAIWEGRECARGVDAYLMATRTCRPAPTRSERRTERCPHPSAVYRGNAERAVLTLHHPGGGTLDPPVHTFAAQGSGKGTAPSRRPDARLGAYGSPIGQYACAAV